MADDTIRVDVPIPVQLRDELQPLLTELRTDLGIRRRNDAGMGTIAGLLLARYARDPELRTLIRDAVREVVRDRAAHAAETEGGFAGRFRRLR